MSHTKLLLAIIAAVFLLTIVNISTCVKVNDLEMAASNCQYYYETIVYWREAPTKTTTIREFSYNSHEKALEKAEGEFTYWLSASETQDNLLDSFKVTLYSDCAYGCEIIYTDTFVCDGTKD